MGYQLRQSLGLSRSIKEISGDRGREGLMNIYSCQCLSHVLMDKAPLIDAIDFLNLHTRGRKYLAGVLSSVGSRVYERAVLCVVSNSRSVMIQGNLLPLTQNSARERDTIQCRLPLDHQSNQSPSHSSAQSSCSFVARPTNPIHLQKAL